jgi:hypothetical protein
MINDKRKAEESKKAAEKPTPPPIPIMDERKSQAYQDIEKHVEAKIESSKSVSENSRYSQRSGFKMQRTITPES